MKYYNGLTGIDADNMQRDLQSSQMLLQQIDAMEKQFSGSQPKVIEGGVLNDATVPQQPLDTAQKMVK